MVDNVYGKYMPALENIMNDLVENIQKYNEKEKNKTGEMAYEHLIYRIKTHGSMAEKCHRKGLPQNPCSALHDIRDAIGIRIICRFIEDIYVNIAYIKAIPNCRIIQEKDYIKHVKANGYRSYHIIVELTMPYEDASGVRPGHFFAEIQLRTIAMDSWASLEHQMKYKRNIENSEMIVRELKRCADELAACDISMQTIRNLIRTEQ